MPLQIRRGTDIQRQAITPAAGELIFVTNTNQLYVGNGSTPGGILATGYTNNDAQDAAAAIFTTNNPAHSSINFAYNTSTNLITATVDLSDYQGVIRANAFKGSVFADDGSTVGGTELVNAVDGSINLNGTVKGNIIPDVNVAYDLGSASFRFRDLYLSGSSIELGAATITSTGSAVNLPAGSTVDGEIIGTGGGNNDYSGNIIGDDSSIIVNTSTNTVSGTFIGDIKGSVFADDSTKIVDAVENEVYATGGFFGPLTVGDGVNDAFVSAGSFKLEMNAIGLDVGLGIISNIGPAAGGDVFKILTHHSEAEANELTFLRTRGSNSNQLSINVGDELFSLKFFGRGSDDLGLAADINVLVDPNGIVGSDIVPGKIEFRTSNNAGVIATKLSIDKDGVIGVVANTLVAGVAAGEVDASAVSVYLKINVGGTDYALPLYAINP